MQPIDLTNALATLLAEQYGLRKLTPDQRGHALTQINEHLYQTDRANIANLACREARHAEEAARAYDSGIEFSLTVKNLSIQEDAFRQAKGQWEAAKETIAKVTSEPPASGVRELGLGMVLSAKEFADNLSDMIAAINKMEPDEQPVCYRDGSTGTVTRTTIDSVVAYTAHRKGMVSTGGHASVSTAVEAMSAQIAERSNG